MNRSQAAILFLCIALERGPDRIVGLEVAPTTTSPKPFPAPRELVWRGYVRCGGADRGLSVLRRSPARAA